MIILALPRQWTTIESLPTDRPPQGAASHQSPRETPPYAQVDHACTVIWQPDQCVMGVASLDGDPSHGPTLLERRLRAQGDVSGDLRILILKTLRSGVSYQAFYMAIQLQDWMKMHSWCETQRYTVRLTLAVELALKRVDAGQPTVLQTANQLYFFAKLDNELIFLQSVGLDDSENEMRSAADMLAMQVRNVLQDKPRVPVVWRPLAFKGEKQQLAPIVQAFSEGLDTAVEIDAELIGGPGHIAPLMCGLLQDAIGARASSLQNERFDRITLLCREYLSRGAMALVITLSVATAVAAGMRMIQAGRVEAQIDDILQESNRIRQPLANTSQAREVTAQTTEQISFLAEMKHVTEGHDMGGLLAALKEAAGLDLRILSVGTRQSSSGNGAERAVSHVYVDGSLPDDSLNSQRDLRSLSGFVQILSQHGWRAEPVDVRANPGGSDNSTRLFSYRISRIKPNAGAGS
jgi:hypothetical protein